MTISTNAKIGIAAIVVIGLIVAWKKGVFTPKAKKEEKLSAAGKGFYRQATDNEGKTRIYWVSA